MIMQTMYPPQKDSPSTFLTGDITAVDTLITVGNASVLPQTLPFPLTIGFDKTVTETVLVTEIGAGNNQLTVIRYDGSLAWLAGARCARVFTASDLQVIQDNLTDVIGQSNSDSEILVEVMDQANENSDAIRDIKQDVPARFVKIEEDLLTEIDRSNEAELYLDANKINRSELPQVITNWVYSADGTEVVVTITRYNASNKITSEFEKTIPIVSNEAVGMMTPEAYNEITALRNDVNALINQGGRFIGVSFATKSDLDIYVVSSSVKIGDYTYVLDDETHQDAITRYMYNGAGWDFTFVVDYDPVGIADNNTPGLVKSDSGKSEGKVFVETDGTMSVVGWNNTQSKIQEVKGDIEQMIITGSTTIPNTGWVDSAGIYTKRKDVDIPGVSAESWVDVTIALDSQSIAQTAEISPTIIEYDGGISVYAKTIPTDAIPIRWKALTPVSYVGNRWGTLIANPFTDTIFTITSVNRVAIAADANGCIARSTDNGLTWSALIANPFENDAIISSIIDSNGVAIAVGVSNSDSGMTGLIARSTDNGLTWSELIANPFENGIIQAIANVNGVLIAVGVNMNGGGPIGLIARSTDNGLTWSELIANPFENGGYAYSIANVNGVAIAVGTGVTGSGPIGMIARSTDNGLTWSELIANPFEDSFIYSVVNINGVAIAGGGPLTGNGRLARSTDNGLTWDLIPIPFENEIYSVANVNGVIIAVGGNTTAGEIARSTDNGLTWNMVPNPFGADIIRSITNVNGVAIAVGAGGKIARSFN